VPNAEAGGAKRVVSVLAPVAGILPFLIVFAVKTFVRWRPFWGEYADPELYFFFDALRVHLGIAPANIDHPGTPVQLLGAAVISATGATPLTVDRYRLGAYILTALVTVAAALLLDRVLSRDLTPMQRVAALWLFWISPAALRYVDIASPESLFFAAAALAAAAVWTYAKTPAIAAAAASGLAIGFAIGIKFVFLPWLAGFGVALAFCGGRRIVTRVADLAVAGGCTLLGFLAATMAAAARYGDMIRWLLSVVSAPSWYGEHTASAPPRLAASLHSIAAAVSAAKSWHLCAGAVLIALLAAAIRSRDRSAWFVLLFAIVTIGANFAIAAKGLIPTAAEGFGDIRYRYLLPSAMAVVLAAAAVFRLAGQRVSLRAIAIVAIAILAGRATYLELRDHMQKTAMLIERRTHIDAAVGANRRTGDIVVYCYAPEPSFALRFATYDRRFLHETVLRPDERDATRPAFNRDFLRMIEQQYPLDGHFMPPILSLPEGATHWDLFVMRTEDLPNSPARNGTLVGKAEGFSIVRNAGAAR
jgi:hypothetical protein